jgi:hypothetical protein
MIKTKITEEEKSKREVMFVNYFFSLDETEQEVLLRSMYNTLSNKLRNEVYEYIIKQKQKDGEV